MLPNYKNLQIINKVKEIRESKGLTRAQLAALTKGAVTPRILERLEAAPDQEVYLKRAIILSHVLDTDLHVVFPMYDTTAKPAESKSSHTNDSVKYVPQIISLEELEEWNKLKKTGMVCISTKSDNKGEQIFYGMYRHSLNNVKFDVAIEVLNVTSKNSTECIERIKKVTLQRYKDTKK